MTNKDVCEVETNTSVWAEVEAYYLLVRAGNIIRSTDEPLSSYNDAGNYIIALAEKIKSQRAVCAMQKD